MKVCLLTHTFPRFKNDTTAAFMHPLCLGLKKTGHEVIVLTPYEPKLKPKDFSYQVTPYRYIWPKELHLLGYSRTLKAGTTLALSAYLLAPFFYFFGALALFRLCRQEKIDLISAHWVLPNGFIAFFVSKIIKTPFTVTLPGSDVYLAKKNQLFAKMAVLAANHAQAVIADSPQFLNDLISLGAQIKENQIIPYPVDTQKIKPFSVGQKKLRPSLNLNQDDLVVLAVARLIYKKGLDYLLKATAPIIRQNKKVKLVIVGDGDLRKKLKQLSKQLKIDKATIFIYRVPREKMVSYYNLADIFIAPSIRDRRGNMDDSPVSLFEAMACGRPVIATNFPGTAKVVEDGVNGFLVEEKDIKSIRRALRKLLQSARLRKKMGGESRRIAEAKLSIEKNGKRYARVFSDIIL